MGASKLMLEATGGVRRLRFLHTYPFSVVNEEAGARDMKKCAHVHRSLVMGHTAGTAPDHAEKRL